MEEITSYFTFWRKVKEDSLDNTSLKQLFDTLKESYNDYSSIPVEEFSRLLSQFFIVQGVEYALNRTEEKVILEKLRRTVVAGKLKEEQFFACFQYWTRKSIDACKVLLVVDVQNDFIRGSLRLDQCPAKEDAEEVVPVINTLIERGKFDVIAYTYDWHPADHCSYLARLPDKPVHHSIDIAKVKLLDKVILTEPIEHEQIMWPVHCVQKSWGAELHKDLRKPDPGKDVIVYKGVRSDVDSYSGFWDNCELNQTPLFLQLMERGVTDVYICGLAFDVCVKYTAEDAAQLGFKTFVIENACRGVDLQMKADAKKALQELDVKLLQDSELINKK